MKRDWNARLIVAIAALAIVVTAVATAGAGTTRPQKQLTIGISHYAGVIPFYRSMTAGFKAAAKKNHWKLVVTDSGFDPSKQVSDIESLIARKVDAIIASPGDASALIPAYKEAAAAKIPIFSIANDIGPGGQKYETAFYGVDQAGIAARRTQYLVSRLGGKGDIIAVRGPAPIFFVVQDKIGYQRVVAKAAGIKTVFDQNAKDLTADEGLRLAQDAFTAHPDAGGVWVENDDLAVGVVQAMRAMGKAGTVPVVSMDGSPQVFDLIAKGDVTYTLALPTYLWALNYSALIQKALQKKAIPKKIFGPAYSVTKGNVASFKAQCTKRPREVWCGK